MPETLLNIETEVSQVLSDLGVTTKLNEMDDFMNQNDLKVQITNENNVTTGLVTYTCTVKDKDNNALANRVVEWYKGTTLLGLDATNSSGISTFSHRASEADIYDLHAVVKGTHAGDDIRMFVKGASNILSHNIWSCGEYSQTLPTLTKTNNTTVELSGEYSNLGNNSLKITPVAAETSTWVRVSGEISESIEKTATGKIYIKCVNCAAKLSLQANYIEPVEGEDYKLVSVDINTGTTGMISVSDTVDDNVSSVELHIQMRNVALNSIIYLDYMEIDI